jgi:hypothetical protein
MRDDLASVRPFLVSGDEEKEGARSSQQSRQVLQFLGATDSDSNPMEDGLASVRPSLA